MCQDIFGSSNKEKKCINKPTKIEKFEKKINCLLKILNLIISCLYNSKLI